MFPSATDTYVNRIISGRGEADLLTLTQLRLSGPLVQIVKYCMTSILGVLENK